MVGFIPSQIQMIGSPQCTQVFETPPPNQVHVQQPPIHQHHQTHIIDIEFELNPIQLFGDDD